MCLPEQDSDEQPSDTSIFGLAPRGVCLAERVTTLAGAPLPHRFTIATRTPRRACKSGCLFSVALVVAPNGSLPTLRTRPAVSRLAALRCSDFPLPGLPLRATNGQRPSHPLPRSLKGGNRKVSSEDWRRRRDSNPRYSFPYTAFPMLRLQPLGHPSDNESRRQGGTHPDFRVSTHRPFQTHWPNLLAGFTCPDRLHYPAGPAKLAVRVGFEPTVQLPVHRFSRPTDSATLAPHQNLSKPPFTVWPGCGAAEKNHGADRHTLRPEPRLSPAGGG